MSNVSEQQSAKKKPDYWFGFGLQAHTEKPFEGATEVYLEPQADRCVQLENEIKALRTTLSQINQLASDDEPYKPEIRAVNLLQSKLYKVQMLAGSALAGKEV